MPGCGSDDGDSNTEPSCWPDVDDGNISRDVKLSWKSDERKAGSLGTDESTNYTATVQTKMQHLYKQIHKHKTSVQINTQHLYITAWNRLSDEVHGSYH